MDYDTFHNIFLAESPQRVNGINSFDSQLLMIREMINFGHTVSNNIFKIQDTDQAIYWIGNKDATDVAIIVNTMASGSFVKVVLTSKNPQSAGIAPYASDLYLAIKDDIAPKNMTFTSDSILSDDGVRLWKGLVSRGNLVSVFDKEQHKYILSKVSSVEELSNYIGNSDKLRYVFVLSESSKSHQWVDHSLQIMEMKRLAGYPLSEIASTMNKWAK